MKYDKNTQNLVADVFKYLIGIIIIVGFIIILMLIIPKEGYKEALIALIGALGGAVTTIVSYEFGSSRSSQRKDELMRKPQPDETPDPNPVN